jgi:heme/copper-type cytochrome/quinol oxidase subunit 1
MGKWEPMDIFTAIIVVAVILAILRFPNSFALATTSLTNDFNTSFNNVSGGGYQSLTVNPVKGN